MADERIIELDTANEVLDDDYLAIDSVSGETRKIKPIKIGATYEIEDGDHEFTLVGSNGYEHTVEIPSDSVSMTQAEYNALTPAQKADGTARFLTDAESDVESELWSKVGRQTLDTDSQVLSNAVNELKGDIDTNTDDINTNTDAISELNSSKANKKWTRVLQVDITSNTDQTLQVEYPDGYSELLFSVQRLDTGRTIGTNTIPRDQFNGGACYVSGSYTIVSLAMNQNTSEYVNGVFIYASANSIEVAFNKGSVNLRARVFAR